MLGHKSSLSKFKKIKIMSGFFSDLNGMKLEISYKKKAGKITNMWSLKSIATEQLLGQQRNQSRNFKNLKKNENENITYQKF